MQFSATVFTATVLPPVFGPVITIPFIPSPMENCSGTQVSLSISGCLASRSRIRLSRRIFGSVPPQDMESFPLEKIKSSFSIIPIFCSIASASSAAMALNP